MIDSRANQTKAEQAEQLVGYLQHRRDEGGVRPLPAVRIAQLLRLSGKHESVRRQVREIVKFARETMGYRICGSDGAPKDCGYWLARSNQEWAAYQQSQKDRSRFKFVSLSRQKESVTDRLSNQKMLFDAKPITAGF